MSLYLKNFETTSEYETYIASEDKVLPNVSFCEDERGMHYNPVHDYSQDYFTMVVTTGGGNVTWTGTSSNALSYSTDDGATWVEASGNIPVSVGDKILWKGITTPSTSYPQGIGTFRGDTNVRYSVEGNVMSLLFGDDFKVQTSLVGKNNALYNLFSGNTNVTSAENLSLPATTLADYCYQEMFYDCTSLTTAPELPATTLASYCYRAMFQNCTSLTTAPELPATTLADYCYHEMFNSCASLTTAPSVLPAITLTESCYDNMFGDCTSLTTAPELPAETLTQGCYYAMFSGCTSLNYVKCLATDISASNCVDVWLRDVAATGTFVKAASMSSWTTGTSGIPNSWTVQNATE
jgi:hypothetical protein